MNLYRCVEVWKGYGLWDPILAGIPAERDPAPPDVQGRPGRGQEPKGQKKAGLLTCYI